MKTFKNSMFFALLTIGILTLSTSCQKEETDNDTTISQDNALAENVFNNAGLIVDEAYDHGNTKGTDAFVIIGQCATITLDTAASPRTLTVDFGTVNCLCNDGRYRRGKIVATYTGRYRDPGTVISVQFIDYYENDNKVVGTKSITNMGLNNNGNPYFDIQVSATIEKANNGGTISWTSTRTREWIAGYGTLPLTDDVYLINGSASGVSASGKNFTIAITVPLRKEIGCKNIVSGTFVVSLTGKANRTFDYGTGSCDNIATVTILNKTYTITLN